MTENASVTAPQEEATATVLSTEPAVSTEAVSKEVEDLLYSHPLIREVAVVAMPDPVLVERACAFVVPEAGAELTLDAIVAYLDGQGIAKQKYPERLELVDGLPVTASGKVQKYLLRDNIRAILNGAENR